MRTLWRTWFYCATCDRNIRGDATKCPHCGVTFDPPPATA